MIKCVTCSISFTPDPRNLKKGMGKYCSRPCYWKAKVGRKRPEIEKHKISETAKAKGVGKWMLGKRHTTETIEKLRTATWQGRKIRNGYKLSSQTRQRMSESRKGDKSRFWKGGITPINVLIRSSAEYKEWRKAVFEKDGYRCFGCGDKGVYLEADHIYPFAYFPRLRFDLNNGHALCKDCHKKTPTFAGKVFGYMHRL